MITELIVFEGGDGSGKSTIGNLVADKLGYKFMESPTEDFSFVRPYINNHSDDLTKFFFYIMTNLDLSKQFHNYLQNSSIVCARYYATTLVDFGLKLGYEPDELLKRVSLKHEDFYQPNKTILLYVSPEIQRERIKERNQGVYEYSDLEVMKNLDYQLKTYDSYIKFGKKMDWSIIDTSNLDVDVVVEESIKLINEI